MLFWILAACLTFVAAFAVLRPFTARVGAAHDVHAHDIEVYRDQLGEVDRDLDRGLIAKEEAEQARAEIGRRILKISQASERSSQNAVNQRVTRLTAAVAVLAVPLVSWGVYVLTGSPGMPSQPLHMRTAAEPAEAPIDELVARAEAHLSENPGDARGWQVLAPIYMRLGRFDDAQNALRNIMRLEGATADKQAALGEAIVGGAQGMVTAEAEAAFNAALELDDQEPRARFFLALARAQDGAANEARDVWRSMLDDLPENSPWHAAAQKALQSSVEESLSAGPSQDDIADASELSPVERRDMIEGMVATLDRKLHENPDDLEGWQRLIRSYIVLKRPDDAKSALSRALDAFDGDDRGKQKLRNFAQGLGVAIE